MHILIVADGRSPTARRWIGTIAALGEHITLVSTFPCSQPEGVDRLVYLPVAFSQLASSQSQTNPSPGQTRSSRRSHLLSSSRSFVIQARYLLGPLTAQLAAPRLRQIIREIQPDLVHALRIPFEGMLAAHTPHGTPLVISIWGNDLTLHAPVGAGMSRATRKTLQRANGLLADVQRDLRLAQQWGFPSNRPGAVVPGNGGIDLAAMQRERSPLPQELEALLPASMPLVINPRGVRAYTRTDTFFQAIPLVQSKHPEVGFVCPSMQNQPLAAAWLQRLNLDARTILLPPLLQGQLWDLFSRSVASVSITTHDGTPNTLLEAMACGSFPIAGDLESLREWITPGENGFLVDPRDPEELAKAILEALEQPERREKAAKINFEMIHTRAEVSVVRPQIASFYQTVRGLG